MYDPEQIECGDVGFKGSAAMKAAQGNALLALLFLCILFSINGKSSAATRKIQANRVPPTISVTGIVFCDQCFQGSLSNELTTPLQGAQVNLECSAEPAPLASAFTDKNGVFKLTINGDYYTRHGRNQCLVTLAESPDHQCSIPTNIGNGSSGAPLSERAGSAPNELIYSVGPFAFRPVRSSCKPTSGDEELPSEESPLHIPTLGPSTYTLIPPIPPAIIPSPYPPNTAPPISSLPYPGSPLLPFCPPPPVIEQPTPETIPPPPAPAIVIPPTPPSPSPIPPPQPKPQLTPPPPPPHPIQYPPVATPSPPPHSIKPPVAPVQHPPPVIKWPPPPVIKPPPSPAGPRPPPLQKSPPIPPPPRKAPPTPKPPKKSPPPQPPHHAPAPSPKPSPKPQPPRPSPPPPPPPRPAPSPKPSPKPQPPRPSPPPPPPPPRPAPLPKPSPKPSPKPQPPRPSPPLPPPRLAPSPKPQPPRSSPKPPPPPPPPPPYYSHEP